MITNDDVSNLKDATRPEMIEAFFNNTAKNATNEKLEEWMNSLCIHNNDKIQKALAINHIQMARVIKSLEDTMVQLNTSNKALATKMNLLTIVGLIFVVIQTITIGYQVWLQLSIIY